MMIIKNNNNLKELLKLTINNILISPYNKDLISKYLLNYENSRLNITNLNNIEIDHNNFCSHFSGFLDGDGSLKTGRRDEGKRYNPTIVIELHKDDWEYLDLLNKYFQFNTLLYYQNKNRNTVTLIVSNLLIINNVLIPLLNEYKLLGKKYYDYLLWKKLVDLYYNELIDKSEKLLICNKYRVLINKYNEIDKFPLMDHIINNINTPKVLGFIEAEGHFSIKPKLQKYLLRIEILQRKESEPYLKGIYNLIENWYVDPIYKFKLKPITKLLYKEENKLKVHILGIDRLYYSVIPTILHYGLYTRKYIDFVLWIIGTIIRKHGLHHTIEGQLLLEEIRLSYNKNRYSLNNTKIPSLLNILKVLSIKPVYDPSKSHDINYRLHASQTKINKNN